MRARMLWTWTDRDTLWLIGIRDFVRLDSQRQVNTDGGNCPLGGKDRSASLLPARNFFLPKLLSGSFSPFLLSLLYLTLLYFLAFCAMNARKKATKKGRQGCVVLLVIGASDASTNQSKRKQAVPSNFALTFQELLSYPVAFINRIRAWREKERRKETWQIGG